MEYGLAQAGTFMHELGHTLGLSHIDDPAQRDVKTVMNYAWVTPTSKSLPQWELDYTTDEWNRLLFQYTYTDLIEQNDAEDDAQPCSTTSDQGSGVKSPPPGPSFDAIDYIHLPDLFPPDVPTYECHYYGTEVSFTATMPFVGQMAMTINIPTPDPREVGDELTLDLEITNRPGDSRVQHVTWQDPLQIQLDLATADQTQFRILANEVYTGASRGYTYEMRFEIRPPVEPTAFAAEMASNVENLRSLLRRQLRDANSSDAGDPRYDLNFSQQFDACDLNAFFDIVAEGRNLPSIPLGDINFDGLVDAYDIDVFFSNYLFGDSTNYGWSAGDFVADDNLLTCHVSDDSEEQIELISRLGDGQVTRPDLEVVATAFGLTPATFPTYCSPAYEAIAGSCTADEKRYVTDYLTDMIRQQIYVAAFDVVAPALGELTLFDRNALLTQMGILGGDANFDGVFDSSDLVAVFTAGQYEDAIIGNSGWATGDWNGDGEFNSSDLVTAFQTGRYEQLAATPKITLTLPDRNIYEADIASACQSRRPSGCGVRQANDVFIS